MDGKLNLLLAYHRRFLLRRALGRSWRAALSRLATEKGLSLHPNSLSHVVAADWHSRGFAFEVLIADVLGSPFGQIWPEYAHIRPASSVDGPRASPDQGEQAA
jgi:lambda repressor-like predicted transcriptional regulator